jgi:hypothetical protein
MICPSIETGTAMNARESEKDLPISRSSDHPYIVLQYTPKSTQKQVKFLFQSSQGFT